MTPRDRETLSPDGGSRRAFLASSLATAAAALTAGGGASIAHAADRTSCPTRMTTLLSAPAAVPLKALTAGNQQAMDLARKSTRIMDINAAALAMADGLADPALRAATLDVLRNPAPTYQAQ